MSDVVHLFALVEVDPAPCTIPPFPEDIRADRNSDNARLREQPDRRGDRASTMTSMEAR